MKQEILIEEIKKILNNSTPAPLLKNTDINTGPYPDILPVILHKLKNKLTPILGYSQILQMKNSDDLLIEKINKIERNAVELTELFDNLKDSIFIKKPVMQSCSINELIVSEKGVFSKIRENGIVVKMELDPHLPMIPLNIRQISLLIRNVIQNSISGILLKGNEKGEIIITTGQDKDRLCLKIRDNGCGIEMSDINNIWTPFFSRFPGRGGIGLLIAEQVMSDHAGKYKVESESGIYTEFMFEFPFKGINLPEKQNQGISVLINGFSEDETAILEKVSGENISIYKSGFTGLTADKIKSGTELMFVNSDITESENLKKSLQKTIEDNPDTEFILFYSGEFPAHLINIFDKENVRVVPDRTKLLTIINILARAINKEE